MHDAELAFVEALHEATLRKVITWTSVADDDREISQALVDGDTVQIEFVYFPTATGGTFEKILATVSGMKTHFQVATGTRAYHILRNMLAPQQSCEGASKSLSKATARVQKLMEGSR